MLEMATPIISYVDASGIFSIKKKLLASDTQMLIISAILPN